MDRKVDLDRVRAQIAAERQKKAELDAMFSRQFVRWYKPRNGENPIRVMPPWAMEGPSAGLFWREIHTHWNIGVNGYQEKGARVDCPVKTPGDHDASDGCAICELVERLWQTGDPADRDIAKEIKAKPKYLINVVDLRDPVWTDRDVADFESDERNVDKEFPYELGDTKIQVYTAPSGVYKALLDYFADLDLTSFEGGRDVIITREGKGLNTSYRTKISHNPVDFEFVGDFDRSVNNLDDFIYFQERAKVIALLQGPQGPEETTQQLGTGDDEQRISLDVTGTSATVVAQLPEGAEVSFPGQGLSEVEELKRKLEAAIAKTQG